MNVRVMLDDGRVVEFGFKVHHKRSGKHTTECVVRILNAALVLERTVHSLSRCDKRDEYNRVTGKAKALERALARVWPTPRGFDLSRATPEERAAIRGRRAIRTKIWRRFYETLQTPDVVFLSGCEKYM